MALTPPPAPAKDPWAFLTTPKFRNFAGNALADLGFGLTQGTDFGQALGAATKRTAQMQPSRDEEEAARLKVAEASQKENATLEYLKRARPDLAEKVAAGMPVSEAWNALMTPAAAPKPIEVNGQLVDPNTYQVLGDFRTPEAAKERDAPSGYQWSQSGLTFIPGGPADPSTKGADLTQAEQRNQQLATVIAPELETLETNWDALTDLRNQTAGAEVPFAGRPGYALTTPEFQKADNALTTIIASYLYSVSGATATDEEIKRQKDILTPKVGESQQSTAQKKARIRVMAEAVADAGQVDLPGAPSAAADPLGIR